MYLRVDGTGYRSILPTTVKPERGYCLTVYHRPSSDQQANKPTKENSNQEQLNVVVVFVGLPTAWANTKQSKAQQSKAAPLDSACFTYHHDCFNKLGAVNPLGGQVPCRCKRTSSQNDLIRRVREKDRHHKHTVTQAYRHEHTHALADDLREDLSFLSPLEQGKPWAA